MLPAEERVVWATAFYAGLRRGELIALRWSDVDFAKSEIRVERGWDDAERHPVAAKSDKGRRTVPIPAALSNYLRELRASTWTEGYVFGREPVQARTLTNRAEKAWKAAELDPITLHESRHTYASLMIAAGVNFKALSEFMGHSDISITLDRDGHLLPGVGDEASWMPTSASGAARRRGRRRSASAAHRSASSFPSTSKLAWCVP